MRRIPHKKEFGKGIAKVEICGKRKTKEELEALAYQQEVIGKLDSLRHTQRKIVYSPDHKLFSGDLFKKLLSMPCSTSIQRNERVFKLLYQAENDKSFKEFAYFTIDKCSEAMERNPKLHP